MKKYALALAVAAVSGQAMAFNIYNADGATLDLYGELRLRYLFDESNTSSMDGNDTRIGLIGQYALTPETYVFGDLRMVANWNSTDNDFDTKDIYATTPENNDSLTYDRGLVGVGHTQYGEIRAGRMASVHDLMFGYDVSWAFGGTAKNGSNSLGTGGETSSLFQYQWTSDKLAIIAQAQGRANDKTTFDASLTNPIFQKPGGPAISTKIKSGYALGASYETDFGLGLSTSYTATELTPDNTIDLISIAKVDATSFGLEATYTFEKLELAMAGFKFTQKVDERAFGAVNHDVDQTGFGASAKYNLTDRVAVYTVYDHLKTSISDDHGAIVTTPGSDLEQKKRTLSLGAEFWPTKQFVTFTEIAHVNTSTNEVKSTGKVKDIKDTNFALGARFYF